MGPDAMIFVLWILSFKPASSLSFLLSSRGSLGPLHFLNDNIRVVSLVYLRLLIFLLEILIPAYDSSSLAFHMMNSVYTSALVTTTPKPLTV